MLTGRKYLLDFTPEQQANAERVSEACRYVWNIALEQRRIYRRKDAYISYNEQSRQFTEARRESDWLAEAPREVLQQALRDLDKACRTHGVWKIHWRSARYWKPTFRCPRGYAIRVERLNKRWARVLLPKIGWARFRWTRAIGGQIRNATVSYDAGRWFVSFCIDDEETAPKCHADPSSAIGVDRGVKAAVVTSDAEFYDRLFATTPERVRLRRLLQRRSRSCIDSRKSKQVRLLIQRHYARTRARRRDFCAQLAHLIAVRYAVVVLKNLKTTNMTSSAAGTVEKPGRNVRAKTALNRTILDKGWYLFERALRSAARYTGTEVKKVPAPYTSQTCSRCRHVDAKSRESQAVFRCTSCGHREHADVNAARNILTAAGHAVAACGDLGIGQSVKQEPAIRQRIATVGT